MDVPRTAAVERGRPRGRVAGDVDVAAGGDRFEPCPQLVGEGGDWVGFLGPSVRVTEGAPIGFCMGFADPGLEPPDRRDCPCYERLESVGGLWRRPWTGVKPRATRGRIDVWSIQS